MLLRKERINTVLNEYYLCVLVTTFSKNVNLPPSCTLEMPCTERSGVQGR